MLFPSIEMPLKVNYSPKGPIERVLGTFLNHSGALKEQFAYNRMDYFSKFRPVNYSLSRRKML